MKIKLAPGAVLFWAVLLFSGERLFSAVFLAALFHELGHLTAAGLLHLPIRMFELDIPGAKLYLTSPAPSYRSEWLLAAGGPLFSVLLFLFLLPFKAPFALTLGTASASLALFNLFPIAEFDGGRMLFTATAALLGNRPAERLLAGCTYLSLVFFFCFSACLLLRYGQNLVLLILTASLFARIFLPARAI